MHYVLARDKAASIANRSTDRLRLLQTSREGRREGREVNMGPDLHTNAIASAFCEAIACSE